MTWLFQLLAERHGRYGAADLVGRPEGDRTGRAARRGNVGALARQVENLLARCVRPAHGPFDEEYAERLIVDWPAPEFRAADADDRDRRRHAHIRARQFRHLARHNAESADQTKSDRAAARGRVEHVTIKRQLCLLAERQPRVVGKGDFEPRRITGKDDVIEKDRGVEAKRTSGAAICSGRLALDAADRADRLWAR